MHHFLADWFLLIAVMSVGLISPGPDFIMTVRNSVIYSRRTGVTTAIGLGLGVAVHVTYCLGGLALIISKSIMIFSTLKIIGALYLFYIGINALRSKGFSETKTELDNTPILNNWTALRNGFITNLFNPKATMFFLALFTQILNPDASLPQKMVYGLTCILMTTMWFSIVATLLTTPRIKAKFLRASKWIDRVCGVLLIGLGIRLAVTKL
jgi:RhtB (resistance to homoserine/threonine) family protein